VSATPDLDAALAPVRDALFGAARSDAAERLGKARQAAAHERCAADEEAARIRSGAREAGAADAAAALAADLAAARQQARAVILAARREAYEQLRAAARAAVSRLAAEPEYPALRARLADAVRQVLGAGADITDVPGGGVRGAVPGRRLDLSLTVLVDRAVDECGGELERP